MSGVYFIHLHCNLKLKSLSTQIIDSTIIIWKLKVESVAKVSCGEIHLILLITFEMMYFGKSQSMRVIRVGQVQLLLSEKRSVLISHITDFCINVACFSLFHFR